MKLSNNLTSSFLLASILEMKLFPLFSNLIKLYFLSFNYNKRFLPKNTSNFSRTNESINVFFKLIFLLFIYLKSFLLFIYWNSKAKIYNRLICLRNLLKLQPFFEVESLNDILYINQKIYPRNLSLNRA